MRVSGVMLGLALVLSVAAPAAAQDAVAPTAALAVTATPVSLSTADVTPARFTLPADISFVADDQRPGTAGAPTHTMHGKQVLVMVQGGLETCCGSTGFLVGVGASFKPMQDNDKFEIQADGNYGRANGVNNVYISFNGQYDFHLQNSKAVPFAGAGIGILHASVDGFSNTDTDLQILGGVDFETSGGRAIRAQIRFLFTPDATTTIILVGFAF